MRRCWRSLRVSKLVTIQSERLEQICQERRPNSRYASPKQVQYEVRAALALFDRWNIPHLEVTKCTVEEIDSRIIDQKHFERRVRV